MEKYMAFKMVLVVVLPKPKKKIAWENSIQLTKQLNDTKQVIYPLRGSISLTIKSEGWIKWSV